MNCRAAAREAGLGHDLGVPNVASISRKGAHCAPENTMPLAAPLRRAREGELPCNFVGRDDLGAPNWPGPRSRRAKRCVHPVGARTARPHTCTRPERRLHGNSRRKPCIASTPAPGSGAKPICRDVIANQIFPQYVDKFVCGRGHPCTSPGGGDSQEGAKRPLLRACGA